MKKNMYYREVFQRKNILKEAILGFFIDISSFPKMVIEVFIRKNMGRRYFRKSAAIVTAVILFVLPFLPQLIMSPFAPFGYGRSETFGDIVKTNWIWYAFVIAFSFFAFLRYKDIKHIGSVFDMNHFSKYNGDILPFFNSLKFKGKPFSVRTIEVYIEPLAVFVVGLFFILIGQKFLGLFLIFCAVVYCLATAGTYIRGDNFILDKVDEIICNDELSKSFISDEPTSERFRFYGEKPTSREWREKIYNNFYEEDDISDAQ